jgi:hypothetical protein
MRFDDADGFPAPHPVDAGREKMIQKIIPRSDVVEHLPDHCFFCLPGNSIHFLKSLGLD